MKKLLAFALALILALGFFACAEGKPYLFQQYAKSYNNVLLLQKENVPQVWLSLRASWAFTDGDYDRAIYFTFPCPEGMLCNEFEPKYASFINDDEGIQYSYYVYDEYSYERLLNRCDNDKYIVYDGSGGIAAYVDPEYPEVCAVIKLDGISKNAKLYVELKYNFPRNYTTDKRVEILTAAAKTELPRVQSSIEYHSMSGASDYWTYGAFDGFYTPSLEFYDFGIEYDLSTQLSRKVGRVYRSAPMFVAEIDDNKYTLFAEFEAGVSIKVTLNLETYSSVSDYAKKSSPDEIFYLTDSRGNEFECYARGYQSISNNEVKTEYSHLQTSLLLSTQAGYNADKNYYLSIDFDLYGYKFSDDEETRKEEMLKLLNEFMSGLHSYDPQTAVFEPAATKSEPQPEPTKEATVFRNGIKWGASQQEVLSGENAASFTRDLPLAGALANATADQVYIKAIETKLSKYNTTAFYVFLNDGVQIAYFDLSDPDGSAAKYLTGAYTKLYGEPAAEPRLDPVLRSFFEAAMPGEDPSAYLIAAWQPADDLAIQLLTGDKELMVFYVNSTYDIDAVLAGIEPDYDLSGL